MGDIRYKPVSVMPCLHLFCDPCVRRVAQTYQSPQLPKCPLCRQPITDCKEEVEMENVLKAAYPIEYEARSAMEEAEPVTFPLPKKPNGYELLKKMLKNLFSFAAKKCLSIKYIFIQMFICRSVMEHFGLLGMLAMSISSMLDQFYWIYESSRNNLNMGCEIARAAQEALEIGLSVAEYYSGYQNLWSLTIAASMLIRELAYH